MTGKVGCKLLIWGFPKRGVPPDIIHKNRWIFFLINHPAIGYPHLWKPPYKLLVNGMTLGIGDVLRRVTTCYVVGDQPPQPLVLMVADETGVQRRAAVSPTRHPPGSKLSGAYLNEFGLGCIAHGGGFHRRLPDG